MTLALLVAGVLGGLVGSAGGLLLSTPPGVFRRVVPFLVAAGSLALLLGPRIAARRARLGRRRRVRETGLALPVGLVPAAIYNGYFGAGSGMMVLAALTTLVEPHLQTANALKNVLIGVGATASAATVAFSGRVDWNAAVPLALGMGIGSSIGPRVARRLPPGPLRRAIVAVGLLLAIECGSPRACEDAADDPVGAEVAEA